VPTRTVPDVATLVRAARSAREPLQRQHDAFGLLIRRFEGAAFSTAVGLTGDVDAARDVCQDAFLDAWRRLGSLREPAAFGSWLLRLIRTQAARHRRKYPTRAVGGVIGSIADESVSANPADALDRATVQREVLMAVRSLPAAQRNAVVLFYFLGESIQSIAATTRVPVGTVGKRLHGARIRLRRQLPRAIAGPFLSTMPTAAFTRSVQAGVFAEFEGEYRFPSRPHLPVLLQREGDHLVSYASGQRNILASSEPDVMTVTEFDGHGRFRRDRLGRVTHFVYYEFGKRLGVARRITPNV
jgi:RNA polymerase sigma factor (sigma-70 family)